MFCFLVAFGVLAWLRRYRLSLDTTASIAAVTALLVYPLAWFQYDAYLLPAIAWVLSRITTTGNRYSFWALFAYLSLRTVPDLMPTVNGKGFVEMLARHKDWIQVIARGILLGAVVAVAARPTTDDEPIL
jgi:hypothetical protein